jgi:hypothetical protein
MILVNVGWIFFRAHSLSQVKQMLSAVWTPASYGMHALSWSLYVLILCIAAGYAVVLSVHNLLERESAFAVTQGASQTAVGTSGFGRKIFHLRWFWITPLYALALLFLLIVTLSQGTSTAQLMYGNF